MEEFSEEVTFRLGPEADKEIKPFEDTRKWVQRVQHTEKPQV